VLESVEQGTRRPEPFVFLRYMVHYADGVSLPALVRWGEGIENAARRTFDPVSRFIFDMPWAAIGYQGELVQATDERAVAYAMHWPNPRPEEQVASIDVIGPAPNLGEMGCAQVFAITLEHRAASGKRFFVAPAECGGDDANSGTFDRPWATLHKAAQTLEAGDTAYVRGGQYEIRSPICPHNSGADGRWISYVGYPGETAVLRGLHMEGARPDGKMIVDNGNPNEILACRTGVFHVYDRSHICVKGLTFEDAAYQGIGIDGVAFWEEAGTPDELEGSHHIDILYNTTYRSGSTGIGSWGSLGAPVRDLRVVGNRVLNAFDPLLTCSADHPGWLNNVGERVKRGQAFGDEDLDIGHTFGFEVAHNEVAWGSKEGIDCKEGVQDGEVHHNYIHDIFVIRSFGGGKAGIYFDTYFAKDANLEAHHNVVQRTGTGIRVMSEGGQPMHDVSIHHNLCLYNYWVGVAILCNEKGEQYVESVNVFNNTVYRNGYLVSNEGPGGGIHLPRGARLRNVTVRNNICVDNRDYAIGIATNVDRAGSNIAIDHNLCYPREVEAHPQRWVAYVPTCGDMPVIAPPQFINPENWNFRLKRNSPAIGAANPAEKYRKLDGSRGDIGAFPRLYTDSWEGKPHRSMHQD
jgi:hypothetical protein